MSEGGNIIDGGKMSAGAGAAAAQAAMINAVRSFGVIVTVDPEEFLRIAEREDEPLIVVSTGGFFTTEYRYLISYKGLAFFTKSSYPLDLPHGVEMVQAKKLLLPG